MKNIFKILLMIISAGLVIIIAIYGAAYYAVAQGWTNVEGEVDVNTSQYQQNYLESSQPAATEIVLGPKDNRPLRSKLLECQLKIAEKYYPKNGLLIRQVHQKDYSDEVVPRMIFALALRSPELKVDLDKCEGNPKYLAEAASSDANLFAWVNTEEWPIVIEAINKDRDLMGKAALAADVDVRLLMMPLAVEQLRLYFSQREFYEKFFKPLKILVSTNQMAWGVMAIKEKSAEKIENNLRDPSSAFYLGAKYEHLLDFSSDNPAAERVTRLNNDKDHSWSYLYGALYLKELMTQWQRAGFPIDQRPEVIATLYNLGFEKSQPKQNPEVGGSTLDIAGGKYTFGGLGFEIYYSGEMLDSFPCAGSNTK